MDRLCRLFTLIALVTAIAGCSGGAGSLADVPSASPMVAPSLVQIGPDPSPSQPETAQPLTPAPTASPTSSPSWMPSPTDPAVDAATVFAANGIGPFVVGARMSELQSRGLVEDVGSSFHCDDSWLNASATSPNEAQLWFNFHFGRLTVISTSSTDLVTPSGARVGMTLTELKGIYGSRGRLIEGWMGNQAFSVRVPDTALGIVFYLDETNITTLWMGAGEAQPLEELAVHGEGC
jgi:hypothetical protein